MKFNHFLDTDPHPNLPPEMGKELAPSPLQGEGWGEGEKEASLTQPSTGSGFVMLFIILLLAACTSVEAVVEEDTAVPQAAEPRSGIVFTSERDDNWDLYHMNTDGSNVARLTETDISESGADWSPDGRSLSFWSRRDGNADLFLMGADGSNPLSTLPLTPKKTVLKSFTLGGIRKMR